MDKLAAFAAFVGDRKAATGISLAVVLLGFCLLMWGCSQSEAPKPEPVKLAPGNMVPPFPPGTPCVIAPPIRSGK